MIQFELKKRVDEIRFKDRLKIKQGCVVDNMENYIDTIKTFNDKESALTELKKYITEIKEVSNYYLVTEYFVEEVEVDEEGEFISNGDIWDISTMVIEVVGKPKYNILATFNNYEEASKFESECVDKDIECCISFI